MVFVLLLVQIRKKKTEYFFSFVKSDISSRDKDRFLSVRTMAKEPNLKIEKQCGLHRSTQTSYRENEATTKSGLSRVRGLVGVGGTS